MEDFEEDFERVSSDEFRIEPFDEFVDAVSSNEVVRVNELLKDPFFRQHVSAETCLIECAKHSCSVEILGQVLKVRPNMRYIDSQGRRALHYVASFGPLANVVCIVNSGVMVNCPDLQGYTPLHCACEEGHADIVRYLIKEGAHINSSKTYLPGEAALHIAAKSRHFDTVVALLENHADVNLTTKEEHGGHSPLHKAAMGGNSEIVKVLCEHGASTSLTDSIGKTALHIAAEKGDLKTVNILLEFGVPVNAQDRIGKTALSYAVREKFVEVVQTLIDAGSDFNTIDKKNFAPLHSAVATRYLQVVDVLLRAGANVNIQTNDTRESPLMLSLALGQIDMVHLLLEYGADVNLSDFKMYSPLHRSQTIAYNDEVKEHVTEALLQAGAKLNARDHQGHTPLCRSIFTGVILRRQCFPSIRLLVEAGSQLRPDTFAHNKNSPLYWLCSNGHLNIAKYLAEAGWCLQSETWIHLPGKTPQQTKLHQMFRDMTRTTRSLGELCRCAIRQYLTEIRNNTEIISAIELLPLPTSMKMFLCLKTCHISGDESALFEDS